MCNSIKSNWTIEELRWKLPEPSQIQWDGLANIFVELVQQNDITERQLLNLSKCVKQQMGLG